MLSACLPQLRYLKQATASSEYFTEVAGSASTDVFNQLISNHFGSDATGAAAVTNSVVSKAPAGDPELTRTSGTATLQASAMYEYMNTWVHIPRSPSPIAP